MARYQKKCVVKKKRKELVNTQIKHQKLDDTEAKCKRTNYQSGIAVELQNAEKKAKKERAEK